MGLGLSQVPGPPQIPGEDGVKTCPPGPSPTHAAPGICRSLGQQVTVRVTSHRDHPCPVPSAGRHLLPAGARVPRGVWGGQQGPALRSAAGGVWAWRGGLTAQAPGCGRTFWPQPQALVLRGEPGLRRVMAPPPGGVCTHLRRWPTCTPGARPWGPPACTRACARGWQRWARGFLQTRT